MILKKIFRALSCSASTQIIAGAVVAPLVVLPPWALAGSLPSGGQFVSGSGSLHGSANGLTIDQNSTRGVIDWQSFSIGQGKTVQFDNGSGATLNEVTGNNLSQIAGSLKATGSVYLVNPSGIIVTPTGKVITQGSFVASSAGNVINNGNISSPNGQVTLISDGHGNVINTGNIGAAQVELNAAGGNVYALAGNNGGLIRATGTATRGGHVWLTSDGNTIISGTISAKNANGTGGTIIATGAAVNLQSTADLDASGTRGGTILVGGDRHGGTIASEKLVPQTVATASSTNVARGARISTNGSAGHGGSVVVWSNKLTRFAGSISARGSAGTKGGFAEVSSHDVLDFEGQVDLTSQDGQTGTLLLDPFNVTISTGKSHAESCSNGVCTPSGNNSILNVTTLENLLASNNVDVNTGSGGRETGDITIDAALTWSSSNTLTLDAFHSVLIDDPVSIAGTGGLNIITNDGGTGGVFLVGSGGDVTFANLSSSLMINGAAYTLVNSVSSLASAVAADPNGDFALASSYDASGDGTYAQAPVSTPFSGQFQGLGNTIANLSIDDTNLDDDVGLFAVLGTRGQIANVVLSNVDVQGTELSAIGGLVGLNEGLVFGDSVSGTASTAGDATHASVGGLVGYDMNGTIANSSSFATVSCGNICSAGGLDGYNDVGSTISDSVASGDVTGGTEANVGGLVGSSAGLITLSDAIGAVSGGEAANVGGLAGSTPSGTITYSWASGAVNGGTGSYDGGLVGLNSSNDRNSYATGDVTGLDNSFVGGLLGGNHVKVTTTYATGNVAGGGDSSVGGLVGYNHGDLYDSYATGEVTVGTGYEAYAGGLIGSDQLGKIVDDNASGSVTGGDFSIDGGLMGYALQTSITSSFATGAVTGGLYSILGGLAGEQEKGTITGSYATGDVSDSADGTTLGGLVGVDGADITSSYATGNVSSDGGSIDSEVGGLVGNSYGILTSTYATGAVSCGDGCTGGGLIGSNAGKIYSSYETGSVTGGDYSILGGLVGTNGGAIGVINLSYATGNVTAGDAVSGLGGYAGGLVGYNTATITQDFAMGNVSGGNGMSLGGLLGYNDSANGFLNNDYAMGAIGGGTDSAVGGLVGTDNGGSINKSYSTGVPTGGSGSYIGGLIGVDDGGTNTFSYWDTTTSGITNLSQGAGNISNDAGITGLTTTQLQSGLPKGFGAATWAESPDINGGLPYLIGNDPPNGANAAAQVSSCRLKSDNRCVRPVRS
jgi:filamentous hemagglutinin family protein